MSFTGSTPPPGVPFHEKDPRPGFADSLLVTDDGAVRRCRDEGRARFRGLRTLSRREGRAAVGDILQNDGPAFLSCLLQRECAAGLIHMVHQTANVLMLQMPVRSFSDGGLHLGSQGADHTLLLQAEGRRFRRLAGLYLPQQAAQIAAPRAALDTHSVRKDHYRVPIAGEDA